jgi:hypothetical protein
VPGEHLGCSELTPSWSQARPLEPNRSRRVGIPFIHRQRVPSA